jgi:hypothetical protein
MRQPVYDVYQMKVRHLPDGVRAAWLRTRPGEKPDLDRWRFVGRERHPSKATIEQMNRHSVCYTETANWNGGVRVKPRQQAFGLPAPARTVPGGADGRRIEAHHAIPERW